MKAGVPMATPTPVSVAPEVADSDVSVITRQVANGVAVRMAVLYLLLSGDGEGPADGG